jgi:hypothetical protein
LAQEEADEVGAQRRRNAIEFTEKVERDCAAAKTSQQVAEIENASRAWVSRLNESHRDLFYRAFYALRARYHILLGQEWGPPYDRPDAYAPGHFFHPDDPRKPEP